MSGNYPPGCNQLTHDRAFSPDDDEIDDDGELDEYDSFDCHMMPDGSARLGGLWATASQARLLDRHSRARVRHAHRAGELWAPSSEGYLAVRERALAATIATVG